MLLTDSEKKDALHIKYGSGKMRRETKALRWWGSSTKHWFNTSIKTQSTQSKPKALKVFMVYLQKLKTHLGLKAMHHGKMLYNIYPILYSSRTTKRYCVNMLKVGIILILSEIFLNSRFGKRYQWLEARYFDPILKRNTVYNSEGKWTQHEL